ncbi:hypothetical protein GQ44DRAFT_788168 [Phaeosphaeriaceae sp. PMI808]|nr:hypothetical protein GQ44DRAFT_734010 [Phaeosphaeriaceae sp. PMI808]KAH8698035.1 hypothetical protein GQ44DRAFT_788168 [Phaeosphaeriaceae sp. PMI808]
MGLQFPLPAWDIFLRRLVFFLFTVLSLLFSITTAALSFLVVVGTEYQRSGVATLSWSLRETGAVKENLTQVLQQSGLASSSGRATGRSLPTGLRRKGLDVWITTRSRDHILSGIPRNITFGYSSACISSQVSTRCYTLPSNELSTGLEALSDYAPELSEPAHSVQRALEHSNLAKISILLIVGALLLVVLSLVVNFLVTARIGGPTPGKRLELFLLVFLLGVSLCVPLALTVGLSTRAYARVGSLGVSISVQRGQLSEICIALLASGIITVLITSINVLLL